MTSLPPLDVRLDCCDLDPEERDARLKTYSDAQLRALLRRVQARLGTEAEKPGDFDCAGAIAHQINNLGTIRMLKEFLRRQSPPPGLSNDDNEP